MNSMRYLYHRQTSTYETVQASLQYQSNVVLALNAQKREEDFNLGGHQLLQHLLPRTHLLLVADCEWLLQLLDLPLQDVCDW